MGLRLKASASEGRGPNVPGGSFAVESLRSAWRSSHLVLAYHAGASVPAEQGHRLAGFAGRTRFSYQAMALAQEFEASTWEPGGQVEWALARRSHMSPRSSGALSLRMRAGFLAA